MTATPSQRAASRWSLPVTTGALLVLGSVTLLVRSPEASGSYGFCPSVLLGIACPGCGGLRGTASLLHGDLATAWASTPLVVLAFPLAIALVARWFWDAKRGQQPWSPPGWAAWTVLGVLISMWVLRNIPVFTPYLGPLAVP